MYFLHRPDIDKYITIHKEDEDKFYEIQEKNLFDVMCKDTGRIITHTNKFNIIKDKNEIKKILDDKFSSRNRTSEYTSGLPSATVISGGLFPYDINYKSRASKFQLLKWVNNISVQDYNAQSVKNKLSLDSGNFIHVVLEKALTDDCRDFSRANGLDKYIEITCNSPEIYKSIKNFKNRKEYFITMAKNSLSSFFKNEINKIEPIFNEIFLNTGKIQGAIDLVNYKFGQLYVSDYKTSKKSMARSQVEGKRYLAQLYIYSRMLLSAGVITKKEYDNLNFEIYFWNWNSGNSAIYNFSKEEVDKSRLYVNFIFNWYWSIKTGEDLNLEI